MTINTIALSGCTPTPLASYLKALGVLRLVASPSNSVTGDAADSKTRGFWENEQFHLRTRLNIETLIRFFLEDYAPSPIIAPWNGGSGFYAGDNTNGIEPLARTEIASRFVSLSSAIRIASDEIGRQGFTRRPESTSKSSFVAALRGCLPDSALDWLDAVLTLSGSRLNFPQLLGTGGNDGRLDFTNNFMCRLVSEHRPAGLFDVVTGKPAADAKRLLQGSLFADGSPGLHVVAVGQFSPGAAGGPNATTGYEGASNVNPWDFVLALEGAVMFAGSATRRHQGRQETGASFPFTVRPTGAGWGGIANSDEGNTRAEFWAPMWSQPASYNELKGMLKEGRAILRGKTARDGLDFARAAASLGISRGISGFQRYGFVMRAGKAYLATPLGARNVEVLTSDASELINELDINNWLGRVRRFARERNTPSRAQGTVKRLEDALFAMTEANVNPLSIQGALSSLGDLVGWMTTSRAVLEKGLLPPPLLSAHWVRKADDKTAEYRVAAALASLGWQDAANQQTRVNADAPETTPHQMRNDDSDPDSAVANEILSENRHNDRIALAAHFAPIDLKTIYQRLRRWDMANKSLAVWGAGGFESNLVAVLERRLIEQSVRKLEDKPLDASAPARLDDIAAFLEPSFDDARCARLLAGLVWAQPARLQFVRRQRILPFPFAYAALKPVVTSDCMFASLGEEKLVPPKFHVPTPPGLVTRLRGDNVNIAVRLALARMRASGVASPFDSATIADAGTTGIRLAAALLIPLDHYGLKTLMERAYPQEKEFENVS